MKQNTRNYDRKKKQNTREPTHQNEKTKRTTDRLKLLADENERIQTELDSERERFELEKGILKQKLEESKTWNNKSKQRKR